MAAARWLDEVPLSADSDAPSRKSLPTRLPPEGRVVRVSRGAELGCELGLVEGRADGRALGLGEG